MTEHHTTSPLNPDHEKHKDSGRDDSSASDIEAAIENAPAITSKELESDPWLVEWSDNDPKNPFNYSFSIKAFMTFQLGMLAMVGSLGSSIVAPSQNAIAAEFQLTELVSFLPVSMYVIGFIFGPSIWAPVSEIWGRRWSLLPPMIGLVLFSIGTAVSKSLAALLVTRFFAGIFGSAPVSNVTAALGDIWMPRVRGTAVALYAVCVIGGQLLGPTIGAAITVNPHLGWRWTEYIFAIWTAVVSILSLFCLPETYAPYLLKKRAVQLRAEKNEPWHHPHEDMRLDPRSILTKHLTRPVLMFFTEPAVTAITLYASFTFGLLYMTLEIYPIVYAEQRGWSPVIATTPFLAMFVGVFCALLINIGNQPAYQRASEKVGGKPVPEARCPPMFVGGVCFAIGLFLFGWTANPSVHWSASVVGCGFIGAGMNVTFQQCINFLIDTYRVYAASAVSANTLMRSILAATLPLAARKMVRSLGVGPAMSVLGGIAVLALPIPFFFIRYGARLRARSRFSTP
jgi:MFS family permease